jgi:hypothetical protein
MFLLTMRDARRDCCFNFTNDSAIDDLLWMPTPTLVFGVILTKSARRSWSIFVRFSLRYRLVKTRRMRSCKAYRRYYNYAVAIFAHNSYDVLLKSEGYYPCSDQVSGMFRQKLEGSVWCISPVRIISQVCIVVAKL